MSESAQWLYSLGKNAFQKKNFEEAREHFEKLVEEVEGFADVWNMLGQIYHHQGEMTKAVTSLEKALQLNPDYADARFNLAVTYSEIGSYQKAEDLYDQARKQKRGKGDVRIPDANVRAKLANMHAEIADVYQSLGLQDDAIDQYKKALTMRPDFPDIRMKMAQSLFDSGKKPAAIAELEEAKMTRPDFTRGRLRLGMFMYSSGKIQDAIREWNEILEIDPDNERAKIYVNLAKKKKV